MRSELTFIFIFCVQIGLQAQNSTTPTANDPIQFQSLFKSSLNEGGACYRIPAIVTASNGDLIVAIDQRVASCKDLKDNDDINIVIRRSQDNGDTWSEMETVLDYPKGSSASDPSMIVDEVTGEIFLFYNYMDLKAEKDIYYLKYVKSIDNGVSWSEPVDITNQISKAEWHSDFKFITSGRGTQTENGKLLHTLVNLQRGLHIFASDDHGQTWYLIDTPISPADESKILELQDGSWMVNSRVAKAGLRYVHISTDQGKSWISKPDSTLVDPACNASIIRYSSLKAGDDKNPLLFANANSSQGRVNMTVRISYDEGRTWSTGKTVYAEGSAYSSMTVLANGEVGLVFEKDFYSECAFVKFSLEWLTDGKDKKVK